jgi:hypothetical protein
MSIETKVTLGLHEFFRYAIPGYIYLIVVLLPIFLTRGEIPLVQLDSALLAAVLVIAGPTIGYIVFHIYYYIFMHFSYNIKRTPPFDWIDRMLRDKLTKRGENPEDHDIEMLVRSIEDFEIFNDSFYDRLVFLYSSFHSLGTIIVGILLGMLSWILWLVIRLVLSDFSWYVLQISEKTLVFGIFALVWIIIALSLWPSWKYRKNLAFMEEDLLVSKKENLEPDIDRVIEAYLNRHWKRT